VFILTSGLKFWGKRGEGVERARPQTRLKCAEGIKETEVARLCAGWHLEAVEGSFARHFFAQPPVLGSGLADGILPVAINLEVILARELGKMTHLLGMIWKEVNIALVET